eukprot:14768060-Alexandrium_andersonii.AAC.1
MRAKIHATRKAMRLCIRVKGSEGWKPKGVALLLTRGRRRVPQDTQGNPMCQSRTTRRRSIEIKE